MGCKYLNKIQILDETKPVFVKIYPQKRACFIRAANVEKCGYITFQKLAQLIAEKTLFVFEGSLSDQNYALRAALKSLLAKNWSYKTHDKLINIIQDVYEDYGRSDQSFDPQSALSGLSEETKRPGSHSNQRLRWQRPARKPDAPVQNSSPRTAPNWYQDFQR